MTFEEADNFIRKRLQFPTELNSEGLARLEPSLKAHAFFSAKVAQGHVLDKLREISDSFSKGEIDTATARARLKNWLDGNGYPKSDVGSKDDRRMANLASTARLNLILRQNARMAAAVGEYEQGQDRLARTMFPYWRYIASTSESPRSSHRVFAGRVFRKDDPIWHRIFPPWDFGCKCSVEEVAADEVDEKQVQRTTQRDIPRLPDSGFAFDPADALGYYDPYLIKDQSFGEDVVRHLLEQEDFVDVSIGDSVKPRILNFESENAFLRQSYSEEDWKVVPDARQREKLVTEINEAIRKHNKRNAKDIEITVGSLLPSQMDQLRYKVAATTVVFRFPGTVDYGFKHWKKHHRNTFDGEAIIDFFGKTIWNPLAKPFICKTGKKVRLVFEWENKDGNALCSLLELNDGRWSIIDAWAPPDQYFRNRKKP